MLQFYIYWINVSAHTKSTIGKVCFVLKSLYLITFLTMGISSDYGREARCPSHDPRKDRRRDRLDKDWTRKASSSDRLAGSRFILQNTSWQDVACFMHCCMFHALLHATLHGSVARFCAM